MKRFFFISALWCASAFATQAPQLSAKGFTLLDKVCVIVEGEEPILLSETKKRAELRGESFADAQKELIRERLLWVYAKKQLKYDIASIYKATDDHISKVMEKNHLSRKQFEDVLLGPPYLSTFRQFRNETATEYLKNSVRQSLASQISLTDDHLRHEAAKKFDVAIITVRGKVAPVKQTNPPTLSKPLTAEINRANAIRGKIQPTTKLNDIKMLYGKDKDISILGPVAYEKDVLKKAYDERLKLESSETVLGPFEDDGAVTMIWKLPKSNKKLDETALEKLRKESYANAVQEKFNSLTDSLINSSTVIEKGCGKL